MTFDKKTAENGFLGWQSGSLATSHACANKFMVGGAPPEVFIFTALRTEKLIFWREL
jgi:hypothetical protein